MLADGVPQRGRDARGPGHLRSLPARIYRAAGIEGLPVRSQPKVASIRRPGRLHRARPADPLQPGRDLTVIQAGIIAAVQADELEHIGAAAFRSAPCVRGRIRGPYTLKAGLAAYENHLGLGTGSRRTPNTKCKD